MRNKNDLIEKQKRFNNVFRLNHESIFMNRSFETVWTDTLAFVRAHKKIKTLDRENENDIINSCNTSITVQSKETGVPRDLSKDDFQYAWDRLVTKRILMLQDIDPELRGKKSIIFAFLANLPYIHYTVRPLKLSLNQT